MNSIYDLKPSIFGKFANLKNSNKIYGGVLY